jgi:hypothetical protein
VTSEKALLIIFEDGLVANVPLNKSWVNDIAGRKPVGAGQLPRMARWLTNFQKIISQHDI